MLGTAQYICLALRYPPYKRPTGLPLNLLEITEGPSPGLLNKFHSTLQQQPHEIQVHEKLQVSCAGMSMCVNCVAMRGYAGARPRTGTLPSSRLSPAPFFPISCFPCSIFLSFYFHLAYFFPPAVKFCTCLSVVAPNCASEPRSETSKNTDWAPPSEKIP